MNASELKYLWQRQQPIELSPENIARITATVETVDRKFRRRIWWRDFLEISTALILATFFGLIGQTWLRWVSVASCLFVVAWFIRSRILVRPTRELRSVIEQLQQMLRETEMQIELLRSILWWYLLPCAVGIFAMVLDVSRFHLPFLSIYGFVGAAMFVAVYWLNQRAARKELEPRRENLRHALAELSQQS